MTRVALYSHDALGLGHIRRSLALARALSEMAPSPDILVLSGAQEAAVLPRPAGCDILGLPGLVKRGRERYAARDLLGVPPAEVRALRSVVARAALTSFAPDLFIVDRHPRGVGGELEAVLQALPGRTRVVLGLRDVLDAPAVAAQEWLAHGCAEALDAWFDAVWIYGDRRVHDLTADIVLPPRLRDTVAFTGYLARTRDERGAHAVRRNTVLGVLGGGADGAQLAQAFVAAAPLHGLSADLVLGPQMPAEERAELHAAADALPSLRVHDFVADMSGLLDRAVAVVSMGGYNTACEVLARGLPTLMVPRTRPRREQLVRASRLAQRGLVDMLHPDHLTPEAVASWVVDAPRGPESLVQDDLDLDGLGRVQTLARALLTNGRDVHVAV